jgi:GNAT superfamily N-acetyltransferase
MIEIVAAETDTLVQEVIALSQEYVAYMLAGAREHYPQLGTAELVSEHDYDDLYKKFPGEHVPPYGRLYLALGDGKAGGCIALGKLSDKICEMRTLFVRPAFRGIGMGKNLVEVLLEDARAIGYTHMRLDTLGFMESALSLYRSFGFREIEPYLAVSDSLKQYIRFLELKLDEK